MNSISTEHCERCSNPGKWQRQNTLFHEERLNWVFVCDECFKEIQAYWVEKWEEYYRSCY